MTRDELLKENEKRKQEEPYDPKTGLGAWGLRQEVEIAEFGILYLPVSMLEVPWIKKISEYGGIRAFCDNESGFKGKDVDVLKAFIKLRYKHDVEYWLSTRALIKIKNSPKPANLIPTKTQRVVLYEIMDDWFAGKPVRYIIVKCRQAFITTIVMAFTTWVQLEFFENWNSLICGDVENQATAVRGMQDMIVDNYPVILTSSNKKYEMLPFEGSSKTRIIKERGCKMSTGSMQRPDNVRQADNMMCHLTEVGLWKDTEGKTPEDLIQAIRGGMDDIEYTMFGLESSPKGTGNYFYDQWISAKSGKSDLKPVYLPWFYVKRYSKQIRDYDTFWNEYENGANKSYLQYLWDAGATLEQINWYINKLNTGLSLWRIQSEWSSNDVEAFQSTGRRAFPLEDVEKMRKMCTIKPCFVGDISGLKTYGADSLKNIVLVDLNKLLYVWAKPDLEEKIRDRYLVVVDIGGTSEKADNSVITVFDRYNLMYADNEEIVAEWVGHVDHDQLAWKSAQIAKYYDNALLVFESNTLETEFTEGDHMEYILSLIKGSYDNLYARTSDDKIKEGVPIRYGVHTNHKSKTLFIDDLKVRLREQEYYERSLDACLELDYYELKEDGTYGAAEKKRDDRVMSRAIGLYISRYKMPIPKLVEKSVGYTKKIVGMSSF